MTKVQEMDYTWRQAQLWQGTRLNGRNFLWSYVSLWDEEDIREKRKVKGVPEFATVFLASP